MSHCVSQCSVLLSQEKERSDLLDQYRALTSEAEQYQTANHQLESEGSNMRLEIMTKDSEMRRLRDKLDNCERDIQEVGYCYRFHVIFYQMTKL